MYRKLLLFLARFLLSLWLVLAGTFLSLLWLNAPYPYIGEPPFALVSINPGYDSNLYLPNQTFSCIETAQQFNCRTKIQGRFLNLSLTKRSENVFNIKDCYAEYDGQAVSCQGLSAVPVIGLFTYEITDLGLSPQQLQRVQQKYWAINILMKWSETQLQAIGFGISLLAGMIAASLTSLWLHKDKDEDQLSRAFIIFLVSVINSIIVCALSMYFFVFTLLSLGYVD